MSAVRVFLNYAVSLDGKISTVDRQGSNFSSRTDKQRMQEIRAMADVIVVGAETVRRDDPPFRLNDERLIARRVAAGGERQPAVCILSGSGKLPAGLRLFQQTDQPVFVATPNPDAVNPGDTPARVEVITLGARPVTTLVATLAGKGFHRFLVEGGGRVNAMFFGEGLVDEIYMTLVPVVLGGAQAPTPVAGPGLQTGRQPRLELIDREEADGELFLHYRVRSA